MKRGDRFPLSSVSRRLVAPPNMLRAPARCLLNVMDRLFIRSVLLVIAVMLVGSLRGATPDLPIALRPLHPTPSPKTFTPPTALLRIAVIGDYGQAGQPEADVARLVHSWTPDVIISVGDNNYPAGTADVIDANIGQYYHDFIAPYVGSYGAGAEVNRFFPSLGNHDWMSAGAVPYLQYFTLPNNERYYRFDRPPVEFFAVDSDPNEPDGITATSEQARWLQQALSVSTAAWKLVYFHHSPYSSALHGSATALQWPFQDWGASAVLTGHDHDYERVMVDGFPYIVNGLGGNINRYAFNAPVSGSVVRFNGDYGAMLIEATALEMRFQFITRAGVLVDDFSLKKPTVQLFLPLIGDE